MYRNVIQFLHRHDSSNYRSNVGKGDFDNQYLKIRENALREKTPIARAEGAGRNLPRAPILLKSRILPFSTSAVS